MGWVVGFTVGGVVVVLVVGLLLAMIKLARDSAGRAEAILAALHEVAGSTRGLWQLSATNATADRIASAAGRAREHLQEKGAGR